MRQLEERYLEITFSTVSDHRQSFYRESYNCRADFLCTGPKGTEGHFLYGTMFIWRWVEGIRTCFKEWGGLDWFWGVRAVKIMMGGWYSVKYLG